MSRYMYLAKVREQGGIVNTRITQAVACAILMKYAKSSMREYGGHIDKPDSPGLNFVQKKATTSKSKESNEDFERVKT